MESAPRLTLNFTGNFTVIMPRWGKTYRDKRNWKEYNEELVIRGKFFFDFDFVDQWAYHCRLH